MLAKPWEEIDGIGGLGKFNAMQTVHTVHWLQRASAAACPGSRAACERVVVISHRSSVRYVLYQCMVTLELGTIKVRSNMNNMSNFYQLCRKRIKILLHVKSYESINV